MLNNDSIEDLPYRTRIHAIKKFCTVANKANHKFYARGKGNVEVKHDEIACADVLTIDHLLEKTEQLKLAPVKGEVLALFSSNSPFCKDKEEFFACRGIRFVQILKSKILPIN